MRRLISFAMTLALVAAACGGSGPVGTAETGPKASDKGIEPASKIVSWHAMGGTQGPEVNGIVEAFNPARLRGHINATVGKFTVGTGKYPRPANAPASDLGQVVPGAGAPTLCSAASPLRGDRCSQ